MRTVIKLIQAERQRQIERGYTPERDQEFNSYRLLKVAHDLLSTEDPGLCRPRNWPDDYWENLKKKPMQERRIIAASLIAADWERVQAIEKKGTSFDPETGNWGDEAVGSMGLEPVVKSPSRRYDLYRMTNMEMAIYNAVRLIEEGTPPDPRVTEIVVLLAKAKDMLSDYLEDKEVDNKG